jgi:integrase
MIELQAPEKPRRRKHGHGSIDPLPSGRFRARVRLPDGKRHTIGTFDTEEECEGMIAAIYEQAVAAGVEPVGGLTLRGLLAMWLEDLELEGSYVSMSRARSICRLHIEPAEFIDWPLRNVTKHAIVAWSKRLAKGDIGREYQNSSIMLLRKALGWAVETKRLDENPANGVKAVKELSKTREPWTYLNPDEQTALLALDGEKLPERWRLWIAFAIGTGLRMGEQLSLRLADLHTEGANARVVVRYGSKKRGPKSGKIRTVPLFGVALEAARRWLELLPAYCPRNPHTLAFPGPTGGFHKVSRVPGWKAWMTAAGIDRRVRWHDLRHTCAASLVSGWWGRSWRLEEVKELLGHGEIRMTERYAHLGPTALKRAATETPGLFITGPRTVHAEGKPPDIPQDEVVPRRSPQKLSEQQENSQTQKSVGQPWPDAAALALSLLEAVAAGQDPGDLRRLLARAVLSSEPVRLAGESLADGPHALDRALDLATLVLGRRAPGERRTA